MKKLNFFTGIIVGIGISLTSVAFASDAIQAYLFPSKVTFHTEGKSKEINITNEDSVINYNNKAYIPLRLFAESLGASVSYQMPSQSENRNIIDINFNDSKPISWNLTLTDGYMDGMIEDIAGISFGKGRFDSDKKVLVTNLQFKNHSSKNIVIDPLNIEYQILKVYNDNEEVLFSFQIPALEGRVPSESWYTPTIPEWNFRDKEGKVVTTGKYAMVIKIPQALNYKEEGKDKVETITLLSKYTRWEYDITQSQIDQFTN